MVYEAKPIMKTVRQSEVQRQMFPDYVDDFATMNQLLEPLGEQRDRATHRETVTDLDSALESAHSYNPDFDVLDHLANESRFHIDEPWLSIPWETRKEMNRYWYKSYCLKAASADESYHWTRKNLGLPVPQSLEDCKLYMTSKYDSMDPESTAYQYTLYRLWHCMREYNEEPKVDVQDTICRWDPIVIEAEDKDWYLGDLCRAKQWYDNYVAVARFLLMEYKLMEAKAKAKVAYRINCVSQ